MIINGKKIKAKEIMEMTGRSERTVRKYFSQSRDDYENSNGSSSSGLRTTKPGG